MSRTTVMGFAKGSTHPTIFDWLRTNDLIPRSALERASADALTVAGLVDRRRETGLATEERSMATVSAIVVVPVALRQDSSLLLASTNWTWPEPPWRLRLMC